MVTWVSLSIDNGKLRRRSHFRVLPAQHTFKPKAHFDDEETSRWRAAQESPEHRRAKELVAAELSRRLNAGLAMPWAFKDEDASDYPLEGNLLLGADQVATEHSLETPFGSQFRLDVAALDATLAGASLRQVAEGLFVPRPPRTTGTPTAPCVPACVVWCAGAIG